MSLFAWFGWAARADEDMDEELRSHMQHRADDLERSGLSRTKAERQARIEFGGYVKYKEQGYEAARGGGFESLGQDMRVCVRKLLKSPGFTMIAAVTLALGIGANAVVFSMMNGLILRPLDVPGARSLMTIERGADKVPMQSYMDYIDIRDRNRSFDGLAAYDIAPVGLNTGGKANSAWAYEASGNYFDVLGVKPYLGRFFHAEDEHGPNSAPYLVLAYAYWRSHFQGDASVIGRVVEVNKHPFTILGVAPDSFRGTELFFAPNFWVPLVDTEQIQGYNSLPVRGNRSILIVGRLKAGVKPEQAAVDLKTISSYLEHTYPKEDGESSFSLAKPGLMGDMLGGPVRAFVTGLTLLASLILLAACANLGSLFAARTADRAREVALRLALGSSRRRIVRQMLTEAMMLALLGGVAGLAGALVLLRWLSAWQPVSDFPITLPVSADWRVYGVTLLVAIASGVLFGMVPVRQVMRSDPYQVVKVGSTTRLWRRFTFGDVLVVIQIAVCAVLVTASLVAVRGLVRSLESNFGFMPQNAMLAITDLDMAGYSGERTPVMQRRMLDAVAAIPGVTAAGLSDRLPLGLSWAISTVFKDGVTDYKSSNATAEAINYSISPGYFKAAATRLVAGRDLTWRDDAHAPLVAVVNQEFARKVVGVRAGAEGEAVGAYYKQSEGKRVQIVGVVEDGKYRTLTENAEPAHFRPILQAPTSSTYLIMRSDAGRDQQHLAAAIEGKIKALDPGLPITIAAWTGQMDSALFASRVATIALGVLGVIGAMLSVTGIFGMAAYSVSKRLRELGIRVALGAQRGEVLRAALGRPVRLLVIGSVAGVVLGVLAARVLAFVVYQATPRDPLVLGGVVVAMALLGVVATWIPARRALSVDPLMLLREE